MAKAKSDVRFKVDLWATDINDVEIGILQDTQHQAQSRQFTKDMEIIGQIKDDDGERKGIIAYRKGLWKDETGMARRLVIKLFTENMNWRGTLDMMIGRSLQLSYGAAGFPVPAYTINLARHEQIIQLERSARKWPLRPESFSFFVLEESGPRFYRLKRDWASIGANYTISDQAGNKVGRLNHKMINLGGAWKARINKDVATSDFQATVSLFCAMLKFAGDAREHISDLGQGLVAGKFEPKLDRHEEDLYMNPRRAR